MLKKIRTSFHWSCHILIFLRGYVLKYKNTEINVAHFVIVTRKFYGKPAYVYSFQCSTWILSSDGVEE